MPNPRALFQYAEEQPGMASTVAPPIRADAAPRRVRAGSGAPVT